MLPLPRALSAPLPPFPPTTTRGAGKQLSRSPLGRWDPVPPSAISLLGPPFLGATPPPGIYSSGVADVSVKVQGEPSPCAAGAQASLLAGGAEAQLPPTQPGRRGKPCSIWRARVKCPRWLWLAVHLLFWVVELRARREREGSLLTLLHWVGSSGP